MRRWPATLIVLVCAMFNVSFAQAQNAEDLFERANALYGEEQYADAAALYDSLLQAGNTSAEVYFNLGNANYKLNNIPVAILNYERARKLEPSDPDIVHNLNLARAATVDEIEELPQLFLWTWFESLRDLFRADTWTTVFLATLWLASIGFACLILFKSFPARRPLIYLASILTFCALLSGYLGYERHLAENGRNAAIIMSPSVYVKSAPQGAGKDVFILHEGTRVEILDELEGWYRIRIANGQVGWSQAETMAVI